MEVLLKIYTSIRNQWATGCKLFRRHEYHLIKKYDNTIIKVGCSRCQKHYAVHLSKQKMVLWNDDIELALTIYESNNSGKLTNELEVSPPESAAASQILPRELYKLSLSA